MVNPKCLVPPDTTAARIRPNSRTPTHVLFSKPLPPRPASTDVTSPRQRRTIQHDWPSESPAIDRNLRRAPARRGRRSPSDEIYPDCDPRNEDHLSPWSPRNLQSSPRPRRSQSCMPTNLIWLEDEQQWAVGGREMSNTYDQFHDNRPPSPAPTSPISPLSPYEPATFYFETDSITNYGHLSARDQLPTRPPPYDSHGFGLPHATRSGNDRVCRWISVVQRMQEDRRE